MNLILRLLWLALTWRRRPNVGPLGPSRTPFRVLPTDLDVLMHVNNGVYLSMMDVARVDLMVRSGLFGAMRARDWYPVVVAQTIEYRRSLTLFQRFEIETRVIHWDDKALLLEQRFIRGDEVIALALVRARFLSKGGDRIPPTDIVALAGNPPMPTAPDWALRWNAEQASGIAARLR